MEMRGSLLRMDRPYRFLLVSLISRGKNSLQSDDPVHYQVRRLIGMRLIAAHLGNRAGKHGSEILGRGVDGQAPLSVGQKVVSGICLVLRCGDALQYVD